MGLFLKITFGTLVVLVTVLSVFIMLLGVGYGDGALTAAGAVIWGTFAGLVVACWALWSAGGWLVHRRRRA